MEAEQSPLLFLNTGTKTNYSFADAVKIKANNALIDMYGRYNIDVADLNNDGKKDLLIGNGQSGPAIYFLENTGTDAAPVLKSGVALQNKSGGIINGANDDLKVYVTDWDEDGGLDLLVGQLQADSGISFYKGDVPVSAIETHAQVVNTIVLNSSLVHNYFTTSLFLEANSSVRLNVTTIQGKTIQKYDFGTRQSGRCTIGFGCMNYSNGVYLIKYIIDGQCVQKRKLFINK